MVKKRHKKKFLGGIPYFCFFLTRVKLEMVPSYLVGCFLIDTLPSCEKPCVPHFLIVICVVFMVLLLFSSKIDSIFSVTFSATAVVVEVTSVLTGVVELRRLVVVEVLS